jgi:hypothetical protein
VTDRVAAWELAGRALDSLLDDYTYGPGSQDERAARFIEGLPAGKARLRRALYRKRMTPLEPVPIEGDVGRGLQAGYFGHRLRDGTFGYLQRRLDDCLQAAVASLLEVPMHEVPDLNLHKQILSGGCDQKDVLRAANERMDRWIAQSGLTVNCHAAPPISGRWIGVVLGSDSDVANGDHCLLMSGRDCLFDPAEYVPPSGDRPASLLGIEDVDYAITIERR